MSVRTREDTWRTSARVMTTCVVRRVNKVRIFVLVCDWLPFNIALLNIGMFDYLAQNDEQQKQKLAGEKNRGLSCRG